MLIVMRSDATPQQVERVEAAVEALGYEARPLPGRRRTAIGILGNEGAIDPSRFVGLPGVLEVVQVSKPYKQVSLEWKADPTVVRLAEGVEIGGGTLGVIAGPCAVESRDQILEVAHAVKEAGAVALRGGAFKPRTSPYSFQGLGEEGLRLLAEAREVTGLPVVTEVLEPEIVGLVADHADVIQIGARNMQNYPLLRRAGRSGRPVLLKRGLSATLTELLLAAEYVLAEGNDQVILCERGVRGFDSTSRNVLDLSAIPRVRARSHLPIIADPSHGTGVRELVPPMALAAVAAGADGLMVEVHPDPSEARSDGLQSLNLVQFRDVVEKVSEICSVLGRDLARVPTPAI